MIARLATASSRIWTSKLANISLPPSTCIEGGWRREGSSRSKSRLYNEQSTTHSTSATDSATDTMKTMNGPTATEEQTTSLHGEQSSREFQTLQIYAHNIEYIVSSKDAPQTSQCLVEIKKGASPCTFIQNAKVLEKPHIFGRQRSQSETQ